VLDEGVVSASTYRFDEGAEGDISVDPVRATSLHVVRGSGRLVLGEASEVARPSPPALAARAGDLFFVTPGAYYRFINDGGEPLTVAEHRIPADVAFV
jgi:oxalate decarboxylase/phosphoglucose isomerase-like protein (cupin superfamily)